MKIEKFLSNDEWFQKIKGSYSRKKVEKKWKILSIVVSAVCLLLIIFFLIIGIDFDFKYSPYKEYSSYFKPSNIELMEKSRTSDDSVCIVTKMNEYEKKIWLERNEGNESAINFYDSRVHMYRMDSDEFAFFNIQYSRKKYDLSYLWKRKQIKSRPSRSVFYDGVKNDTLWDELQPMYYCGKDDDSRLDDFSMSFYSIKDKKVTKTINLKKRYSKKKEEYEQGNQDLDVIGLNLIKVPKSSEKYISIIDGYYFYPVRESGWLGEKCYSLGGKKADIDGPKFYDALSTHADCENPISNYIDTESFNNLLKKNGINTDYIHYSLNLVDYNNVNLWIRTEGLPKENARLYKAFPGLKKYIGQKNKWARIYIKGMKNSDEVANLFLPEGKEISYGDGVEIGTSYVRKEWEFKKKTFNSLDDYFGAMTKDCQDKLKESAKLLNS